MILPIIVTAVIRRSDTNEVLLVRYKNGDNYQLPGGSVETNETLREALIRNIKADLNLDIVPKELLSATIDKYGDAEKCLILSYSGVISSGQTK